MPIPGRVAWVLQEAPTLLWVYVCVFCTEGDAGAKANPANRVLLGLFTLHYINRTIVFPMRLRGGKNTPFLPFFFALVFCVCNGYLQARSLTYFETSYPEVRAHICVPRTLALPRRSLRSPRRETRFGHVHGEGWRRPVAQPRPTLPSRGHCRELHLWLCACPLAH